MSSNNNASTPEQEQKKESYTEWAQRNYAEKRESWMPWMEDVYLRWFGKDNKASYATKRKFQRIYTTISAHIYSPV